jgi:hypothetical protein
MPKKDNTDLPERRVKNLWVAAIVVAGLIIGIILIIRGDPDEGNVSGVSHTEPWRGLLIIAAAFVIAGVLYALNNRHHVKAKADDQETEEFTK